MAYFLCSALRYLPAQCFIEFSDMYAVHKTMIQLQRHLQSFYAVLIPVLSPCYARNCIVRVKIPFICKSSQLHPGKACKINQISCQSYTLPRLSSYREIAPWSLLISSSTMAVFPMYLSSIPVFNFSFFDSFKSIGRRE